MSSSRVWLFRVLIVVVAGLMLLSWFMPWWSIDLDSLGEDMVVIRPWGLEQHLGKLGKMLAAAEMPPFFAPFMWTYLGVCMVVLLIGLFAPDKKLALGKIRLPLSLPQVLIGGVGLSYMVAALVAAVYASIRLFNWYELPLQGYKYVSLGEPFDTGSYSSLQPGYWLAWLAGLLLVVLALLRNKIVGKRT